jgi:hypothetical protein
MAEKKASKKSQTKAGMLGKKDNQAANEKDKNKKEDTENTPKISKEKAEGHHDDKPLH